ncbi:MAG: triose-phosphate isomerase [Spirochaetia bacterium]|nr:triose-phosphate isomerase [Spirochaetia bacterium]
MKKKLFLIWREEKKLCVREEDAMPRRPILAANWKMNLTSNQSKLLVDSILNNLGAPVNCEIILFPSFLHIPMIAEKIAGKNIGIGGQNLYFEEKGAYTGEIAAFQLVDSGCTHVLIGHSERRHYFHENYETVNKKVLRALSAGLKVMLCVGESLEERENNVTEMVVVDQIESAMQNISHKDMNDISIAYEPIWAIGTGRIATPDDAAHVHQIIRKALGRIFDKEIASKICILYGGSVKPDNIKEVMAEEDIDGVLVGGASLKTDSLLELMRFLN